MASSEEPGEEAMFVGFLVAGFVMLFFLFLAQAVGTLFRQFIGQSWLVIPIWYGLVIVLFVGGFWLSENWEGISYV